MRVHANLMASRPRLALPLSAGLWIMCVVFFATSVLLSVEAFEMRDEEPRLKERIARLGGQIEGIPAREALPPAGDLEAMRRRVGALNALTGMQGWNTSQLFVWFEKQMPDNVYLVSFHHKPRDGEILLVAESASAESLTAFLLRLEKEPRFSEVLLSKQGARGGSGASALQFEVRVRQKP